VSCIPDTRGVWEYVGRQHAWQHSVAAVAEQAAVELPSDSHQSRKAGELQHLPQAGLACSRARPRHSGRWCQPAVLQPHVPE
jgi:hypothetical protein